MSTAFFESDRLFFRAPEPDDAPKLVGWLNDPRVRLHLDHRVWPMTEGTERKWIESMSAAVAAKTDVVFVFGLKDRDELIGASGLHGIHWVGRHAEWGIMITPSHWNMGYGREVAGTLLRYAFDQLNLNRVSLRVNADNEGGIKCYEAVGFVREGVLRQAVFSGGTLKDMIVMSMLRDEYRARADGR